MLAVTDCQVAPCEREEPAGVRVPAASELLGELEDLPRGVQRNRVTARIGLPIGQVVQEHHALDRGTLVRGTLEGRGRRLGCRERLVQFAGLAEHAAADIVVHRQPGVVPGAGRQREPPTGGGHLVIDGLSGNPEIAPARHRSGATVPERRELHLLRLCGPRLAERAMNRRRIGEAGGERVAETRVIGGERTQQPDGLLGGLTGPVERADPRAPTRSRVETDYEIEEHIIWRRLDERTIDRQRLLGDRETSTEFPDLPVAPAEIVERRCQLAPVTLRADPGQRSIEGHRLFGRGDGPRRFADGREQDPPVIETRRQDPLHTGV